MEISVGQSASRSMIVTPEIVERYAELTGDHNPLHFDEEFASKTRFKRLISQGGIAVGLLHALVAMDLPGAGTVFTEQHWNFPAPVYIGDTITATGTITEWTVERHRGAMDFVIVNQDDVEVLTGTTGVYQAVPKG
ncbi:MAG: MaoC family dehydratase [Chloroflexi bacterium]|jgi:acyl dehydratase|nr:MaoC family dehydratase [Chloroflexota bacterium]